MSRPRARTGPNAPEADKNTTDQSPDAPDQPAAAVTDASDDLSNEPSKSQRKRDMTALQALGVRLAALPDSRLTDLNLPERLTDALRLMRRIRANEGLRRQRQFVGRVMREEDIDIDAVRARLDGETATHRAEVATMHAAEYWRDRLLDDPVALTTFIDQFPHAAQAGLSGTIAQARRARNQNLPPRHARTLFRMVQQVILQAGRNPDSATSGTVDAPAPTSEAQPD